MFACVLEKVGQLTYKEVPTPVPEKDEVLIKIKASGICGSDIDRVFKKGTYSMPMIPGHEFSGQITAVGENVSDDIIGKRAAVFPLRPCKSCDMCEVGEYASCRNYNYFGSRCDGGFAEYIAVPVWNLVIPDGDLSFEELALAEPAAVSLHALQQTSIRLMDTVAIFGAGAIGLMLGEFARALGAGKVILLDIDAQKIAFAQKMGFEYAINNGEPGWAEKVMEQTHGKGVDIAIEGAGVSASVAGCLTVTKPLGQVVLMGNPLGDIQLAQKVYWEILRKQLTVKGTWNSSYTQGKNEWQAAMGAILQGKLNVSKFITHKFSLSECTKAFDAARDKNTFTNRVMFIND